MRLLIQLNESIGVLDLASKLEILFFEAGYFLLGLLQFLKKSQVLKFEELNLNGSEREGLLFPSQSPCSLLT